MSTAGKAAILFPALFPFIAATSLACAQGREGAAGPAAIFADDSAGAGDVDKAKALLHDGDVDGAIALCNTALGKSADDHRAHALLAACLITKADLDGAQPHIDAALKLLPDHAIYLEIAGEILIRRGKLDAATALYDKAVAAHPAEAGAVYNAHAAALATRNDRSLDKTIDELLHKAAAADPPSPDALYALGESNLSAGRAEGKAFMQKFIDLQTALPADKRDEQRLKLARQLVRAYDILHG